MFYGRLYLIVIVFLALMGGLMWWLASSGRRSRVQRQYSKPIINANPFKPEPAEPPAHYALPNVRNHVRFTYQSGGGEISERTVIVRHVRGQRMDGFCLLRHDERTFRLDRIVGDVVCMDTGEVLKPYQLADIYGDKPKPIAEPKPAEVTTQVTEGVGPRGGYFVISQNGRKKYLKH